MKTSKTVQALREHIGFLLLFAFALFLYLFNISFSDLWSDEFYTKSLIRHSYGDMIMLMKKDLHPPLYFLGLKLFTSIFGLTTYSMRIFSVIGALSTISIGYFVGQRVLGKKGALYYSVLLISLPMIASYAHEARMYTWAAFSVTGVFLYACVFITSGRKKDLLLLAFFTLLAMYIHYYSLVAAISANLFVLGYLLWKHNENLRLYLIAMLMVGILFLPWLFMFISHFQNVQGSFWAPVVSWEVIKSCFTYPFAEKFWISGFSLALAVIVYGVTLFAIFFNPSRRSHPLAMVLSLYIFLSTLTIITLVSLVSQPILYFRYVSTICTMLMVPPAIFLASVKSRLIGVSLMGIIIALGIKNAFSGSYFSFGPYKQTVEYIADTYPAIQKVLHISEITAGPMLEYNGESDLSHYWLKARVSNVDLFAGLHQIDSLADVLKEGEIFCAVQFNDLDLNKENLDLAMSESDLITTDPVADNKVENGNRIVVYVLRYVGEGLKKY